MNICPVCSYKLNDVTKKTSYPGIVTQDKKVLGFSEILFCSNCKLGIASPDIPEDALRNYYEKGGYWKQSNPGRAFRNAVVPYALAKSRWEDIENLLIKSKNCKDISILDIGAGHGFIGVIANESSNISLKKYTYVEPDLRMRQCLDNYWLRRHDKYKLEMKKALNEVVGQYNVIILSHVLEHIKDPLSMLESVTLFTISNSILLLDVPNQDYIFKENVFPHILFFNQESLKHLINKAKSIDTVFISGYGKDMDKSPLNKKISLLKIITCKIIWVLHHILPHKLLVKLYTAHLGIDHKNSNGTWIRALCRRR